METENCIFHYTSIDTLARILDSQSIRFNRLDKLDDMEEGSGIPDYIRSWVFTSCWTESSEENIALWKMYADRYVGKGVRIALPRDMFKIYNISVKKIEDNIGFRCISKTNFYQSYLPFDDLCSADYFTFLSSNTDQNINSTFYKRIIYDKDYKQKNFDLIKADIAKNTTSFAIPEMGQYKSPIWEFQKESRFTLFFLPLIRNKDLSIKEKYELLPRTLTIPKSSELQDYYLKLDENILNHIKVRLSPLAKDSDKIIVKALLDKYTTNGSIEESNLRIR
ncbi:hypothetical protein [Rhizosphaericola mali]|uniref:DUF2971 domain-containing protein n=1 Tax=Rhizosphaericola mali TaxID=2545455 RepID=A0A5P2G3E1_9BACT|nr:hypothetical protein [Rhizosphaericola mali]QES90344.1 hypothetical protein E0W69_017355 [Rhizosphaericola mali]